MPSAVTKVCCCLAAVQVWDLSDIDKDGHLDKDEFAVVSFHLHHLEHSHIQPECLLFTIFIACLPWSETKTYFLLYAVLVSSQAMHLVYRALEKEPVPALLPASLVPLSKRKKSLGSVATAVPGLPASPPPPKDSLRSTPSHGSMNSLNSAGSLSPKHSLKSAQVTWTSRPAHVLSRRWEVDRKCCFFKKKLCRPFSPKFENIKEPTAKVFYLKGTNVHEQKFNKKRVSTVNLWNAVIHRRDRWVVLSHSLTNTAWSLPSSQHHHHIQFSFQNKSSDE